MHPVLRARAERRLGLFTTAEAKLAGYGHGEIRSLCATGRWIRLRRGVLVTAEDLVAGEQSGSRGTSPPPPGDRRTGTATLLDRVPRTRRPAHG